MAGAFSKEQKIYNGKIVRMNINSQPVDPAKLKEIFKEKGLYAADISRSLGYGANTISSALSAGVFGAPMITALKNVYGIDYSEYAYIPEEKKTESTQEPEEQTINPADNNKLYETMKLAMLDAINEALAANMKNLRGMIYTAISQAKQ